MGLKLLSKKSIISTIMKIEIVVGIKRKKKKKTTSHKNDPAQTVNSAQVEKPWNKEYSK